MFIHRSRTAERKRLIRPLLQPARFKTLTGDRDLEDMMRASAELDAKNYAGGWCQLMNWKNAVNYPFTHSSNWTAISDITHASEVNSPCIPANTLVIGSMIHVHTWGIVGSAAGSSNTTVGLYLNGAAAGTQISISAAATPATATVQQFHFDQWIMVLTEGSSGTLNCAGTIIGISATPATDLLVPATQPAAPAINTTVANGITAAASWVTGAAGNLYTVNGHGVFLYN